LSAAESIVTAPPIAGSLFREVAGIPTETIGGNKRKRLLALLAAFADAGEERPPVRLLARQARLGSRKAVVQLLKQLEEDRWIRVSWASGYGERNRYRLTLDREERAA
jgi:hypothetical protein